MSAAALDRAKRRTAIIAAAVPLAMVGLAYASVPLYRIFCAATGYSGTTGRAAAAPALAEVRALGGRTVKIRFDGNTSPGMAWRFGPRDREIKVRIGERQMAFFTATNYSDQPTTGQAVFNVSPDTAGAYFKKIACFCFTLQTLAPHQTVEMPVTFYVDPAIVNDPDARKIDEITLSYTFYPVDNPAPEAVSATPATNRG